MTISAIIRCHEDPRVLDCIKSMEANEVDYEVVVALTETSHAVAELLRDVPKVCTVPAPVGNLSASSNIGIAVSQHDKVVLLDADLICDPGYLDALDAALEEHMLVRSNIQFAHYTPSQRLVAELRDYVYSTGVFYCPGAAFRKELSRHIGGHFFNDSVWWTEDAELNFRIEKAGLNSHLAEDAVVTHLPERLGKDLRGAHKIGMGKHSQVLFANRDTFEEGVLNTAKRLFSGKTLKDIAAIHRHTGSISTVAYSLVWTYMYYMGYYRSLIGNKLKRQ